MGKRRTRAKASAGAVAAARSAADDSDDELVRGDLEEDELRDELDEFERHRERKLLGSAADEQIGLGGGDGVGKREVLAFDDDSGSDDEYDEQQQQKMMGVVDGEDDDDGDDDLNNMDTLGDEEGLPSDKAWGKRKGTYYSADYVDEDWRGATREETLELAEMEEREARAIQRRLTQQIEEDDLQFGLAAVEKVAPSVSDRDTLPLDTSRLSRAEKLELLQQESPELLPLMEEFRRRWTELSTRVNPVYKLWEQGRLGEDVGATYIRCRQRLLLHYCLQISYYLQLRAAPAPAAAAAAAVHPVMRRIAQYAKLLQAMEPAHKAMDPELDRVNKLLRDGVALTPFVSSAAGATPESKTLAKSAKRLRLNKRRLAETTDTTASGVDRQLAALTMEIEGLEQEKKRLADDKEAAGPTFTELRQAGQTKHNPLTPFRKRDRPAPSGQGTDDSAAPTTTDGAMFEEGSKRSITHQMAKNKGLMPKRSKESRNPRVKHKEKFKRALKKRRSMVRLPKKELQKYGGEVFGIRMGAVKSMPIK